ncbi:putative nitrate/nitrite transporter NarK2 [Ktedonobacter sp. SOSP1-85]|uniref:MFS transporter n=1 Tax=Ktedonobacter sp. SOSP1-85 TaxID=2778367 RepID=UPI0019154C01|nr:MFS transporter [Ktedonobacter sp. SOSP1-85]GHO74825.1 putative nitrate/nitrite transporter NarK2 [Ktedonobacter sp. SOSP1-85]
MSHFESSPLSSQSAQAVATVALDNKKQTDVSSVWLRILVAVSMGILISIHYTNYSPLASSMKTDLHINSGEVGLFSTLLFVGMALTYMVGGVLADRFGAKPVLLVSCAVLTVGSLAQPLVPNLLWMLGWQIVIGFAAGCAFLAGANVIAGLGRYATLGQGLYGGSVQLGAGIGLLATPLLLPYFGWRGCFFFWGVLSIAGTLAWFLVREKRETQQVGALQVGTALRSPSLWLLGLSHMGTFSLGNAIAATITLYLTHVYGLSLVEAGVIGSLTPIIGTLFRPLGGWLLARHMLRSITLLRLGTAMGCLGVALLACPFHWPWLAAVGLGLIGIGSTVPYASVFNSAANLRSVKKGLAQGFVSMVSTPPVIVGPPLIGLIFDRTGSFLYAYGLIVAFGCIATGAAFLARHALKRESLQPASEI